MKMKKEYGTQLALTIGFGPIGLIYSSISAFVAMFLLSPVFAAVIFYATGMMEWGPFERLLSSLGLPWLLVQVVGLCEVETYNEKLEKAKMEQESRDEEIMKRALIAAREELS